MKDLHLEWVKTLKVGDYVCDCRYKHLKIAALKDEHLPWKPLFVVNIVYSDHVPRFLAHTFEDAWEYCVEQLGIQMLTDRDITFDDGTTCSAYHCCGPVDHDELIHKEEE